LIKAHFVRERNLELGAVEVQGMRTTQDVGSENIWFANNVNEVWWCNLNPVLKAPGFSA